MNGKISLFVLATLVTVTVLGSTTATMAQMMPNATNATMDATMGEMATQLTPQWQWEMSSN